MAAGGGAQHLTALFEQLGDVVDPPALLRCLNLAAEHYLTIDPSVALGMADALVAGAAWNDRPELGALGLLGRGDALRRLGRPREAVEALDDAAAAFRALPEPDDVGWARTRIGWIVARHELGDWEGIETAVDAAMAVFALRGEALRAVKLAANAGAVHFERAEYPVALARFDQALEQCAALDPALADVRLLAARVRSNRALVSAEVGRFEQAIQELERARAVFEAEGHADSALAQALNIAYVQRGMGEYAEALRQLDRVARAAEGQGARAREASARHEKALILLELGDYRNALWQAERAHALYGALESAAGADAEALVLCAEIQATLGDADEAFEMLDLAEALAAPDGGAPPNESALLQANIAAARAEVSLLVADHAAAEAEARRAMQTFDDLDRRIDAARAGLALARAQLGLGHVEAARAQAQETLARATESAAASLLAPCHHVLASVAMALGDGALAARHLAAAMGALEDLTSRMAPNLRTFFQASQRVYQDAIDHHLARDEAEAAFGLLERSKSRALLAHLAGAAPAVPVGAGAGEAVESERAALTRRHHYQYAQLQQLASGPRSPAGDAKIRRLQGDVREMEARLNELGLRGDPQTAGGMGAALAATRAGHGARSAPGEGPAVGKGPGEPARAIDDLRAVLPEDAVLVEYAFSPARGTAFVITRQGGLERRELGLSAAGMEDLAGAWRDALESQVRVRGTADGHGAAQAADALQQASRHLYDALIEPVADRLEGRQHLIVVPYGAAHALAFGALHDGTGYLIERLDVSTSVSAEVLRLCLARETRPEGAPVVLGDDWRGRLPGCRREAVAVAEALGCAALLDGDASTRAVGRAAANQCTVLHVAAHGEARLDNPLFAHIALSDGHLTAMDAARLRLDGALVVLSACETGRSAVVGGDEVVGLSGAFLWAGAAAVVQSLWRIDDRVAEQLMTRFHAALQRGRPVAAALREAQLARLAEPGATVADWAPFQVTGDGAMALRGAPGPSGPGPLRPPPPTRREDG